MSTTKKDKSRVVLRSGEVPRTNGSYQYSWMDGSGKRRYVYAKTLEELRIKEEQIAKDKSDGIKTEARYTTLNEWFDLWKTLKRWLKASTIDGIHTVLHQVLDMAVDDNYIRNNPSDRVLKELTYRLRL